MTDFYQDFWSQNAVALAEQSEMPWQSALRQVIGEFAGKQPSFGTIDCMQFVARYVAIRTGKDYAPLFGEYTSEAEANAIIEARGGLVKMIESCLGSPRRAAAPGDVVVALAFDYAMGGVLAADGTVFAIQPTEPLGRFSGARIVAAWSI